MLCEEKFVFDLISLNIYLYFKSIVQIKTFIFVIISSYEEGLRSLSFKVPPSRKFEDIEIWSPCPLSF